MHYDKGLHFMSVLLVHFYLLIFMHGLDSVQDGWTELHAACQEGHCGIVGMLLAAKADVNAKNNVS